MQLENIKHSVNETLNQGFEIPMEKLVPEANLFTDLKLDSLDAIDMIVYLEEKLGIKVEGDVFKDVRTLGDVYEMISKLKAAEPILQPTIQPLGQPLAPPQVSGSVNIH